MDIPETISWLRRAHAIAMECGRGSEAEYLAHAANNLESLYRYVAASKGRMPGWHLVRTRTLFGFGFAVGALAALAGYFAGVLF